MKNPLRYIEQLSILRIFTQDKKKCPEIMVKCANYPKMDQISYDFFVSLRERALKNANKEPEKSQTTIISGLDIMSDRLKYDAQNLISAENIFKNEIEVKKQGMLKKIGSDLQIQIKRMRQKNEDLFLRMIKMQNMMETYSKNTSKINFESQSSRNISDKLEELQISTNESQKKLENANVIISDLMFEKASYESKYPKNKNVKESSKNLKIDNIEIVKSIHEKMANGIYAINHNYSLTEKCLNQFNKQVGKNVKK